MRKTNAKCNVHFFFILQINMDCKIYAHSLHFRKMKLKTENSDRLVIYDINVVVCLKEKRAPIGNDNF